MQTVNFQCGNCNNLMAVSAQYLGQQVRCPHCQAVVVAPSAAAPAPAAAPAADRTEPLTFQSPPANEQEDIFSPPEPTDDLFGRQEGPRVELPDPAPAPAQQAAMLALDGPANPAAPAPADPFGSTMAYAASPAGAGDAALPSWMDHPAGAAASAPAAQDEGHGEALPQLIRKPRDSGGWFIGLVFIPLLSYSLLTTIAVVVLWFRLQQAPPPPPNPLENLPALDPADPSQGTHLLKDQRQSQVLQNLDVKTATLPLSSDFLVQLGKTLQIGDLEVSPLRVGFETVSVRVGSTRPEPCQFASLVMHLKLKNISKNVVFQPMDSSFDRRWRPSKGGTPPLTLLELIDSAGRTTRFFGGPQNFHPPLVGSRPGGDPPEVVEGNHYSQVLNPGEEMETFVCTDGEDKAASDAINSHHGKLLWRVHMRRGVVPWNGRLVPVSSVIGVQFTDEAYR